MSGKKHIVIPAFLPLFLFLFNLPGLSQDHPYLLNGQLLEIIQNEVSGERAWDMAVSYTHLTLPTSDLV